jgi:outer membrane protein assembly factor BamB
LAVLLLAGGAAAIVWLVGDRTGQERVMQTLGIMSGALVLMLAWVLLLSRLPWRTRVLVTAVAVLAMLSLPALFRVQGVSGDFVPILEWRWKPRADARMAPLHMGPVESARPSEPTDELPVPTPPEVLEPETAMAPADDRLTDETATEPDARDTGGAPAPARTAGLPDPAPESVRPPWADYPQFLGPDRNATIPGVVLARDWEHRPPRLIWRQRIGAGWSGFAVAGPVAVTQEQRGDQEMIVAYDLQTGSVRWAHGDHARYATVVAGTGPRATPTISGDRVFTLGATGLLTALDLTTGRRLWQRDLPAEHGAPNPDWGRSGSPLVLGDLVIVSAGGPDGRSLVAYDRHDGRLVWSGGDDAVGYSSPLVATLGGRPQIVIFNARSIAAHHPESGRVLWSFPWPGRQPNVAQPVVLPGDRLLLSSGYGIGSKLLHIESGEAGPQPSLLWKSPRLKAKFTNVVFHDGFIYGLDDGVLVCLDPANGQRRWRSGRYGHGQVILVGDLLLVQTEQGEIVLVDPNPEAHREVARFDALDGKTWNTPALATPYLLVRNDVEAACYELPLAGDTLSP